MSALWRSFVNGAVFLPAQTPITARQPMRWVVFVGGAYIATRAVMSLLGIEP